MPKRRLPNKNLTDDINLYVKSWKDLAEPLRKVLDAEVLAFDPGVLFSYNNNTKTVSLDTEFLLKLNKALEKKDG